MKASVVCGLGFGDEGKGKLVDYLVRQNKAKCVVRFSGGPQCAHNVVTKEGLHHTFHQFGSGLFAGAPTMLGPKMMVDPFALINESSDLKGKLGADPIKYVRIHPKCPIITPYHIAANRIRMTHLGHGSCGCGVGELGADLQFGGAPVIRGLELKESRQEAISERLEAIRQIKFSQLKELDQGQDSDEWAVLRDKESAPSIAKALAEVMEVLEVLNDGQFEEVIQKNNTVWEGSQGALLDQDWGFHPHTTWSKTTPLWALESLLEADYRGELEIVGVTRTYHTRHGAGPFPSYMHDMTKFSPKEHNQTGKYQGAFLSGAMDFLLLQYGMEAFIRDSMASVKWGLPLVMAVTHADLVKQGIPLCGNYQIGTECYDRIPFASDKNDLAFRAKMTGALFHSKAMLSNERVKDIRPLLAMMESCYSPNRIPMPVKYVGRGPTAEETDVLKRT